MSKRVTKGQKVWAVTQPWSRGGEPVISEHVVEKCGPKYFTLSGMHWEKFAHEYMMEVSQYQRRIAVYPDIQEYHDGLVAQSVFTEVRKHFGGYRNDLPLEKLRRIKAILDEPTP